jgi:hypothetical protein
MKAVLASLLVLAVLGGQAHAYYNLADRLFAIRAYVSGHVADEDFGDEFRRLNN